MVVVVVVVLMMMMMMMMMNAPVVDVLYRNVPDCIGT